MRKRIVLAGCAALAGVLIFLLLSVNSLVERNRAFLIGRAEQAFGRKLSVGQIRITFWPIGARLQDFALADDPAFSAEDFVRAKEFRIELRLLPLFSGEIRPKRMMLESPMITLVRDASGRYNFASRNRREKPGRDGTDSGAKRSTEWDIEQLFLLPAFALADGTLRYRDLAGSELVISRINLKAGDFEPDQPFAIELEAAVNAAEPNLRLRSRIGPVEKNRDLRDIPLDGQIDATDLDLGKVNRALPQLRKALPKALRFDGVYTIKELRFKGTLNNLSLKGAVTGTDASFRFE